MNTITLYQLDKIMDKKKYTIEERKKAKRLALKKWRDKPENKEKSKQYGKNWRKNNPNYIEEWKKENQEYGKNHYKNNKEKYLKQSKNWCEVNSEIKKEMDKNYRNANSEKIKIDINKWREENPNYQSEYTKKRNSIDIIFRVSGSLRKTINKIFKNNGYTKKTKTHNIVGCSYEFFIQHIESQWSLTINLNEKGEVWMNWSNYGKYKKGVLNYGWDIDHKIPLSSTKIEEKLIELCHYTNLQPLCSYTNRHIKKNNLC